MDSAVNLAEKLASFDEHFALKIVGYQDVELGEGELFVVPRGVEHCPRAAEETHLLLIESRGTPNVGDADAEAAPEVEI